MLPPPATLLLHLACSPVFPAPQHATLQVHTSIKTLTVVIEATILIHLTLMCCAVIVTTVAGNGNYAYFDGVGTNAYLSAPVGVAVSTGIVIFADSGSNSFRRISISSGEARQNVVCTRMEGDGSLQIFEREDVFAGVVSTVAGGNHIGGYMDGFGTSAQFNSPLGVAVAVMSAPDIYTTEMLFNGVRKVNTAGCFLIYFHKVVFNWCDCDLCAGVVTTIVGSVSAGNAVGTGTSASFSFAYGLVITSSSTIYVADSGNNQIRTVIPLSGRNFFFHIYFHILLNFLFYLKHCPQHLGERQLC